MNSTNSTPPSTSPLHHPPALGLQLARLIQTTTRTSQMVSLFLLLSSYSPFSSCPSSAPTYGNATVFHQARFLMWPPGSSMVQSLCSFFSSLHSSFSSSLLIPKKHFTLLGLRTFACDLLVIKTSPRDPWVAQRFGTCLWPRARSWRPGIESHVRLPVHGA